MIHVEELINKVFKANNPEKSFPYVEIGEDLLVMRPSLVSEVIVKELFNEMGLALEGYSLFVHTNNEKAGSEANFNPEKEAVNIFIDVSLFYSLFFEYIKSKQIDISQLLEQRGFDKNADLLWSGSGGDDVAATFKVMLGIYFGGTIPHSKHFPIIRRTYAAIANDFITDWQNDALPESVRKKLDQCIEKLKSNATHELMHLSLYEHAEVVGYTNNHEVTNRFLEKCTEFQRRNLKVTEMINQAEHELKQKAFAIKGDDYSSLAPDIQAYKKKYFHFILDLAKGMEAAEFMEKGTDYMQLVHEVAIHAYKSGHEEIIIRLLMNRGKSIHEIKDVLDKQCFFSPGYLTKLLPDRQKLYEALDVSGAEGALVYMSEVYPADQAMQFVDSYLHEDSTNL